MSASRPPLVTIRGKEIRLEPFTRDRIIDLMPAIGHPIVFEEGYGGGIDAFSEDADLFAEWALDYYNFDTANPYLVVVENGPLRDRVIGTTTLGDFNERNESAHIGWTAFDPRVWGSVANAESKYLLLELAFSHGFGRIKIQTDIINKRSQKAIQAIGATYEGISRRDKQRADGTWRDAAVFSIIIDDWPRVKANLERMIEDRSHEPIEFRDIVD
ncbi:MAG: GNAT family N-acetyltransferase [Microbacteriaceae bacterium]|nr:GNAT family N-acetyltransferase [Microbacteriaceae bacterium]